MNIILNNNEEFIETITEPETVSEFFEIEEVYKDVPILFRSEFPKAYESSISKEDKCEIDEGASDEDDEKIVCAFCCG